MSTDAEVLAEATKRFAECAKHEQELRARHAADLFYSGYVKRNWFQRLWRRWFPNPAEWQWPVR